MSTDLVLVTGGSGFIATHCILKLLAQGYRVRTTVRNLAREGEVRAMLKAGGAEPGDRLTFAAAELSRDEGWAGAAQGCAYVLHVASPIPPTQPKNENDLIIPAREGALRVLKAARDAGAKRVVMTSSVASVGYGKNTQEKTYTEEDWSDVNGRSMSAYAKSKTIAERAAWDFVAKEGRGLELATILPALVLGPVLSPDFSPSVLVVQRLMMGAMPGCPKLYFSVVDVRDVAELHVRAMTSPAAAGQRLIASAGNSVPMVEIARILKRRLGAAAAKVPARELPNWMVWLASWSNPEIKQFLGELGVVKHMSGAKAQRLLNWTPITIEEATVAAAQSLIATGALK
ncbi:MAG TPA: epimerase [Alphaproteobacteria bacterium]|nr:epimerase [Alphaproteobacteria bacterium]HAJ46258.1 epimerase [Alphaproteobacteria bacterium]